MLDLSESVLEDLVTVADWVRYCATQLNHGQVYFGHGTDNAWDEAAQLVLFVIATPWEKLEAVQATRLIRSEKQSVLRLLKTRIESRKPLAYLTGEAHFCGMPFKVSEQVLIPRSPIGELIENHFEPWLTQEPERILDLCTGSGCIGIACAHAFPEAEVVLSDISEAALSIAQENIDTYQLEEQVTVVHSDLFDNVSGKFDLIVSNPPYVDAADMAALPQEYRHEPELALASGEDGLDFTRRLLEQAAQFLTHNGVLIVEVGNSWPALEDAFDLPFTWLSFENGGHGVFMLTHAQLVNDKRD